MTPDPSAKNGVRPHYILAIVPLVLLGALLAIIIWSGPADAVRGANYPPVERLTFQRVTLEPGAFVVTLMNDGPDEVALAQVQVDDAFWTYTSEAGNILGHLGRTEALAAHLAVEVAAHGALGYAEGRFLAPVYPGDTLSAVSEVIGLKANSNGQTGVVTVRTTGDNVSLVEEDASAIDDIENVSIVSPERSTRR